MVHEEAKLKINLIKSLKIIISSLPRRRLTQIKLLIWLIIIAAIAEILTLGSIVPFLALMLDPELAYKRPIINEIVKYYNIEDRDEIKLIFTYIFVIIVIVAALIRFILTYATAKLNFGIGHELGAEVYRRTLNQSYEVHISRNSSAIIGSINKVDIVVMLLLNVFTTMSASIMTILIMVTLLIIDPLVAITTLFGFGSIYFLIAITTKKQLSINSEIISETYNLRVKTIQEGLGGIRDVLLGHAQQIYLNRFNEIDWQLRQAQSSNNIIAPSPRYFVESLGTVIIAIIAYQMTPQSGGFINTIPTLGALVLGAQRIMPLLQQVYQGWTYIRGNRQVLNEVVELVCQPVKESNRDNNSLINFNEEIKLEKITYKYLGDEKESICGINLKIKKGEVIGFIGSTGSGKSTLMNLIMGLLKPTKGRIIVDNYIIDEKTVEAWQNKVAHVPQDIFLADTTFLENIAYGIPKEEIDYAKVKIAAEKAKIAEFIESKIGGYEAKVGERGVRLSGGQKQRIGIARALYKDAQVLIFDEATSALDIETEKYITESIESLDDELTILVVAHRITTLKNCNRIIEIEKGKIKNR